MTKNRISSILGISTGAFFFLFFVLSKSIYMIWVEHLPSAEERSQAVVVMTVVAMLLGGLSLAAFQLVEYIWSDEK